jgi:nitroreductase/NAD-dependent dihydropyrimidine dehydrogenase PreA subunit
MSMIVVDEAKCVRDGACVAECPSYLIDLRPGDLAPKSIAGAEERCIDCGHCVAVCPSGALSLRDVSAGDCQAVHPELLPSAESTQHLLAARRSIRAFRNQVVERETLARLLEAGRYAPTGSNTQLVEWLVYYETAGVRRISGLVEDWTRANGSPRDLRALELAAEHGTDRVCRGAPHLVLAHVPKGREGDGMIALTYLEIAAAAAGVGACWAGFVTAASRVWAPLQAELALPEGRVVAGGMLLGYPRYAYQRIPPRRELRAAWR